MNNSTSDPARIAPALDYAPGVDRVWYRLKPIDAAIVGKTHIVYPLGAAKMQRLQALFLDAQWEPTAFSSYDRDQASNPFVAFAQIPARRPQHFET